MNLSKIMHEVIVTDKATQIAAIEAALVALRRAQRRRALAGLSRRRGGRADDLTNLPDAVFEFLDVLAAATERGDNLTVTDVATQLDVDQPRASRLAGLALRAALIRRAADQRDGRRSLLVLTAGGEDVIARIHDFRRRVVAEVTNDWSDDDRAALAHLLPRFVAGFGALTRLDRSASRSADEKA
ncbi:MarR family winged helix-turn-helix transcriptional regulator [Micromonospora sp. WMMA1363]|uniref:MarR family winged helix-turn-helix transcriptional regulator n=1 Tax=Micromonospora sp. WMMA1363 TaxID=3053985 RepID=UPI00259CABA4|nr:MarR family winged helix-turn-helix transcriptional regulator [Micromonospora sp. WMMA1363]MDM4718210.1 MarR family winged helix-turn-helix transcriptional regulator [Micromonospora sp. WMMA1363]